MSVPVFADRLSTFSERVAVTCGSQVLTYGELDAQARAFAGTLGESRRLTLLEADRSLQAVVMYVGLLVGRHPTLLVAPGQAAALQRLIDDFAVETIIRPSRPEPVEHLRAPAGGLHQDLAVLLSTSGSTGSAKLVKLSRANLESNAAAIADYLELRPDDVAALSLPLHYSYGLSVLNSHLAVGAAVHLMERSAAEPEFLDEVVERGATNIPGVPFTFELLDRHGARGRSVPGLRFLTVAGGRAEPDLVVRFAEWMGQAGGRFYVMYGQTEAAPRIAYLPAQDAARFPDCIGRAIPGGELNLRDETGAAIEGVGRVGELIYRGPNVMMGYATDRAALGFGSVVGELATGDLAERLACGYFRIAGRKSRFSKIAGFRIGHEDVQTRLRQTFPGAVVTGNDEALVVAVERAEPDAVRAAAAAFTGLPSASIRVGAYEALPRLDSGKPDLQRIVADAAEAAAEQAETEDDGSVLGRFRRAFWPRFVSQDDSFSALGGDSLTYLQLSMALEEKVTPLPEDWDGLTVADLETLAAQGVASTATAGAKQGETKALPPDVYLRAAAIALVVFNHFAPIPNLKGGTDILLVLIGFNIARFQVPSYLQGKVVGPLLQLGKNLGFYFVVLAGLALISAPVSWTNLLLVSNLIADGKPPLVYNVYWFVEAYAWITLAILAVMAVPWVRGAVARWPFACGLLAFAVCLAARWAWRHTDDAPWNAAGEGDAWSVFEVGFLAAAGWMAFFADGRWKLVFTLALLAVVQVGPVLSYTFSKEGQLLPLWLIAATWPIAATAVLALGLRLRLWRPLATLIQGFAANSYFVYLLHLLPIAIIHAGSGRMFGHQAIDAVVYAALGLALGFLGALFANRLGRLQRGVSLHIQRRAGS